MVPIWLFQQADANGSLYSFTCGPSGTAANQPFVVVRAKPAVDYANIWGDGVIVPLAYSSDDQYAGSNIEWQRVLDEQADTGVTIFVRGDSYEPINYYPTNKLTPAQLDSLNKAGAEVLGHSLYHGGDVSGYDPNCGCYSFIADQDSIDADLGYEWLEAMIGETVDAMAWPRHIYSLDLWEQARDAGLLWARDGTNEQFGDCGAVVSDGVDAGEPTYVYTDGTPVAMYALKLDAEGSPGWYAPWDNGAAADSVEVDAATLAERIRFCIGRATWQGRRPVLLFTHDIRGGNYDGAEGLNPGELEDMIQATPAGGKWMRYGEIMDLFIANSVPCDPPAGSASATYGHTAADALWRKVP
ncbi:hypothetical protein KDK88_04345, partial [bacterium]|nr:hypothetical protein [bacterium]